MSNNSDKELIILESAVKIFSEKGFNAATTNEIAKEAGIAEGTIFRYFKTKKDILHKIIIRSIDLLGHKIVIKPLEDLIEKNNSLNEKELLKEIVKERLSLVNKNFPLIKVILTEAMVSKEIREIWINKIVLNGINILSNIIERGIENGTFKKVNSITAIRSLASMIISYMLHKNLINNSLPVDEDDKEIDTILEIFFNGITFKGEIS